MGAPLHYVRLFADSAGQFQWHRVRGGEVCDRCPMPYESYVVALRQASAHASQHRVPLVLPGALTRTENP